MDLNSPEFYTIAFVVAMALVALLMGRREKQPPSTYIVQLQTVAADDTAADEVRIEPMGNGNLRLRRTGITLGEVETVNLVITVQEEHCSIVEKKGVKRRGAVPIPVTGEAVLKCLRSDTKYRIRYESQLTSSWATFTLDTSATQLTQVRLKY